VHETDWWRGIQNSGWSRWGHLNGLVVAAEAKLAGHARPSDVSGFTQNIASVPEFRRSEGPILK
jgi:hypothetical protein